MNLRIEQCDKCHAVNHPTQSGWVKIGAGARGVPIRFADFCPQCAESITAKEALLLINASKKQDK